MVQISRHKVDEVVWEQIFQLFFELLKKIKTRDDFTNIIECLFSRPERIMVAKRIALIYLISKEIDASTICYTLKISRSTYAKFAVLLDNNKKVYPYLKRIMQTEALKDLFAEIYLTFRGPGVYGTNWSSGREIENQLQRKKKRGL